VATFLASLSFNTQLSHLSLKFKCDDYNDLVGQNPGCFLKADRQLWGPVMRVLKEAVQVRPPYPCIPPWLHTPLGPPPQRYPALSRRVAGCNDSVGQNPGCLLQVDMQQSRAQSCEHITRQHRGHASGPSHIASLGLGAPARTLTPSPALALKPLLEVVKAWSYKARGTIDLLGQHLLVGGLTARGLLAAVTWWALPNQFTAYDMQPPPSPRKVSGGLVCRYKAEAQLWVPVIAQVTLRFCLPTYMAWA
jgi:hypothetical protein